MTAGKAKYLAFVNARRFEGAPGVPAVREIIPGFEAPPLWSGFFGPPNLPQPIVKRLHGDITRIVATTEVRARLFAGGLLASAIYAFNDWSLGIAGSIASSVSDLFSSRAKPAPPAPPAPPKPPKY